MNSVPSPTTTTTTTTTSNPATEPKRKPWRIHFPTTIRIRKTTVRLLPLLNFLFLTLCCSYLLLHTLLSAIALLTELTSRPPVQAPRGCNGHPALCARRYSNITHIGAHDSAFVGILPSQNQDVPVATQLDAGIRFLQVQTHANHLGQLALCHTDCLMEDAGLLRDYLAEVSAWLERPGRGNEVVTILLTNPERIPMPAFENAYRDSGLEKHVFTPPPKKGGRRNNTNNAREIELPDWPTLQSMIDTSQRVVSFMDYAANTSLVPYLLPEFAYFWETPFDTTDPASITTACEIDRPSPLSPKLEPGFMYIVNHFLDTDVLGLEVPDRRDAGGTNGEESLRGQMGVCESRWGRRAWGVLVDYFETGRVMRVQDEWNGVGDGG